MNKVKLCVFLVTFLTLGTTCVKGQDSTYVLSVASFNEYDYLLLPEMTEWRFHEGNDILWANPDYDHTTWQKLDSMDFAEIKVDENGLFEAWLTIKIKLDSSFTKIPLYLRLFNSGAADVYIDGKLFHSFGNTNYMEGDFVGFRRWVDMLPNIALPINQEVFIAVHFVELNGRLFRTTRPPFNQYPMLGLEKEAPYLRVKDSASQNRTYSIIYISILSLVSALIWLIVFLNPKQIHLKYAALTISFLLAAVSGIFYIGFLSQTSSLKYILTLLSFPLQATSVVFSVLLIARVLEIRIPLFIRIYLISVIGFAFATNFVTAISTKVPTLMLSSFFILCVYYFISRRARLKGSKMILAIGFILSLLGILSGVFFNAYIGNMPSFRFIISLILPISLLIYIAIWLKEMIQDAQEKAQKVIQITEEKKILLENQNSELERQVNERTSELNISLEHLKSTQTQLIHSEKMASLGELTAGIAHEIQNPLNFVNNFSEVSSELVDEMSGEIDDGNLEDVKEITADLKQNLEKINHRGQRASSIVKGMLEHSRTGDGTKELTDINKLADEYLRLSYHGLRAKDKSFNADFTTDFDESIPQVKVVPQDIGRVLLNLINNAFQACTERSRSASTSLSTSAEDLNYKPLVTVSTTPYKSPSGDLGVEIRVKDNGSGIPDDIKDKIFQPFFTTKPTGQGTGLGLSMSYDIITKGHGGELKVETTLGKYSMFIINLPLI